MFHALSTCYVNPIQEHRVIKFCHTKTVSEDLPIHLKAHLADLVTGIALLVLGILGACGVLPVGIAGISLLIGFAGLQLSHTFNALSAAIKRNVLKHSPTQSKP